MLITACYCPRLGTYREVVARAMSASNSAIPEPLSAQISIADVDQKPPYNCIFYAWGTGHV